MLIGLGYKKRSGKDTVGAMLGEMYGFKVLSFAKPLKELGNLMVNIHTGKSTESEYQAQLGHWASRYGMSKQHPVFIELEMMKFPEEWFIPDITLKYRTLLQKVGTDVIREGYSQSFWIDAVARQIKDGESCVVTDVRFKNEKSFIEANGYSVRVDRDTGLSDNHVSENELNGEEWAYIIDNNGDLCTLRDQVSDLYGELLKRSDEEFESILEKYGDVH